jgi:D-alanine-D-alanine ligase
LPAKLPKKLYDECVRVAAKVYSTLGLSGISRVDLLIDEKAEKVYFNEVNPMPGDLYAHNFAKNGISNVDLVSKLLAQAEANFATRKAVTTTFNTNYLKQF